MTNKNNEEGEEIPPLVHTKPKEWGFDSPKIITVVENNLERFARCKAAGLSGVQAMKEIFPKESDSYRRSLLNKFVRSPRIRTLIREHREALYSEKTVKPDKINVEFIKKEYLNIYSDARENGDRNTALKVLDALGKHLGMFVDKSESKLTIEGQLAMTHETIDRDLEQLAKASGIELEFIDGEFEEVEGEAGELSGESLALPSPSDEEQT